MPVKNLTDRFVRTQLKCPESMRKIEYCDYKVPGLLIEVRHASPGRGTYFLRYRDANHRTRYAKIGRTMDISLADARKVAVVLRGGILQGKYPDKKSEKTTITFQDFFEDRYLPFVKPRKRSWRDDEKLYRKRLKALFGSKRLDKITRHSLQQMHSDLREELSASSCDHHLGLMSRCLKLATEWKLLDENPAQGLKKFNEDNRRDRLMTNAELQRLMKVLDTHRAKVPSLVIKWLMLTACRKGEALSLRWPDINLEANTWTIQAITAKSKRRRIVPLSSAALGILKELQPEGNSEWVFLNSRTGERLKSIDKAWQDIRREAGLCVR